MSDSRSDGHEFVVGDNLCKQGYHFFMNGRCTACLMPELTPQVKPVEPEKQFDKELHRASLSCNCAKTTHKGKNRLCEKCEGAWQQAWDVAEGKVHPDPKPAPPSEAAANCECQCQRPPKGWRCTREVGHSGPCAAIDVTPPKPAEAAAPREIDPAIKLLADVMHLWIDGYISKAPNSCADDSISSNMFDKIDSFLRTKKIRVNYCGWELEEFPDELAEAPQAEKVEAGEEIDDDLTDDTCPSCGEEGVAYGSYCHMTGNPWPAPEPAPRPTSWQSRAEAAPQAEPAATVELPELLEASMPAEPEAWEHEGRLVTNRSYKQWIVSKDDFDEYAQGMRDVLEERERQLLAALSQLAAKDAVIGELERKYSSANKLIGSLSGKLAKACHEAQAAEAKVESLEKQLADARKALEQWKVADPIEEWHEDMGACLWWIFPLCEPPYSGTPLDCDWPGHHTHFTRLKNDMVPSPRKASQQEAKS